MWRSNGTLQTKCTTTSDEDHPRNASENRCRRSGEVGDGHPSVNSAFNCSVQDWIEKLVEGKSYTLGKSAFSLVCFITAGMRARFNSKSLACQKGDSKMISVVRYCVQAVG